jgi:Trypsin
VRTRPGAEPDARDSEEAAPADHHRPRRRARWYARPLTRAGIVSVLAIGTIVTVAPSHGSAGDIATGFVRAVRHLASSTRNSQAFAGTPAVGALFTTSDGRLDRHFCSGSVLDSPNGDLVITAAHCVTGTSGTIDFVPGYDNGATPYGTWTVTKVYVDQAWSSAQNPDDDFAILQVRQAGSTVPI